METDTETLLSLSVAAHAAAEIKELTSIFLAVPTPPAVRTTLASVVQLADALLEYLAGLDPLLMDSDIDAEGWLSLQYQLDRALRRINRESRHQLATQEH